MMQFPFTQLRTSVLFAVACAALVTGCVDASDVVTPRPKPSNTSPPPDIQPGMANVSIAGFVIDESSQCIIGARVELMDGPKAGVFFVQTECDFWSGGDQGYYFGGLPHGIPVTLRATGTGFKPSDTIVTPTNTQIAPTTMITLARAP